MSLYQAHIAELQTKANAFLEKHQLDILILTSGSPQYYYDDDIEIPHRIPASFRYWIPEDIGTNQFLVITKDSRTLYNFSPKDFWLKVKEELGEWQTSFTVETREQLQDIQRIIQNTTETKQWAWLGPDLFDYDNTHRVTLEQKQEIDSWRLIKTEFEIECLKIASARAASAHLAVRESLSEYISEFQMNLDYLDVTGMRESEMPYGNIIAYNEHASILHYQELDHAPPAMLYSFLIDAGASFEGYIADITRTHAGEDSDDLFRTLLTDIRTIKLELIAQCKAGVSYLDIHSYALELIGELLIQHEFLINVDVKSAIEKGLVRIFFPHGIGHLLGLNTHDTPSVAKSLKESNETFKNLRLTQQLQTNMVLTIEPGIYFNNTLISEALLDAEKSSYLNLDLINEFLPYGGIRDEDNIVIQEGEAINLTAEAFKQVGAEHF